MAKGNKWTAAEDKALKRMIDAGLPYVECARALSAAFGTARTVHAVQHRLSLARLEVEAMEAAERHGLDLAKMTTEAACAQHLADLMEAHGTRGFPPQPAALRQPGDGFRIDWRHLVSLPHSGASSPAAAVAGV